MFHSLMVEPNLLTGSDRGQIYHVHKRLEVLTTSPLKHFVVH